MKFLRSISDHLPAIVEEAGIGIAQIGIDGRIVAANTAFGAMLGRTPESLAGSHWSETIHSGDYSLAHTAHEEATAGRPTHFEARGLRADGSTIDQTVRLVGMQRSARQELSDYFCVRQNITSQRMSQSQFALALDVAPVGVLILDRQGTILTANKAIETLFHYTRAKLAGQSVEMLMPDSIHEQRREHRQAFNRNSQLTAMAGCALVGLRADGVEIPVQVYLNVIGTVNSQVLLCTIIDIEPRLRYEEQLEKARLAAESANRAKSDFLARMSHEIRTPMNLIMGMGSLLLETPLTPMQRQYVEVSYRNVRRLVRLTNGILDLSKVEAGMLKLESHPFEIESVITEAMATMATAADRQGIAVRTHIDEEVPRWWIGDSERIIQILLNLVGNSIKFTTEGSITVRVSPTAKEGVPGLSVQVEDTGCGITDDQAEVIFEAFQQADSALNRRFEGSGLGLTISRSLCRLMGGDIELVRKPPPGSIMKFTIFPTCCEAPPVDVSQSGINGLSNKREIRPGIRILLAEDNPENVFLIRAYLDGFELTIEEAADGREAIEMAKANHYDIILMDIQMPIMDGLAATRAIRTFKPNTPIIALTAHALVHAASEAASAGCNAYVTKPLERADIIKCIAQFASPKQPAQKVRFLPDSKPVRAKFLQNRRRDAKTFQDAQASKDYALIQRIGHDCRGCSKGYGFADIGLAAASIESAVGQEDLETLNRAISKFTRLVEEACELEGIP